MKIISVPALEGGAGQSAALPAQIRAVLPGSSQLPQIANAADALLVRDQLPRVPTRRLIVLVPSGEIDEHALARRVWQLATCTSLDVLYLALAPDEAQTAYQLRRLAGLAALTSDPHFRMNTRVHTEKNWSQALRQTLRPGDLLICLAQDYTPGLFRRKPVGERLAANLNVPVYLFGDLEVNPSLSIPYWIKNVVAWIASIALIVVFFWLQVWIDRFPAEPQSTILLYLSIPAELYVLWKINDWIG